jgi:hypothetical protein
LVIQPEQVTHKLVGIKSCLFDSESFSESNQESGCADQIRQHYSSTIHQQTGWYQIPSIMLSDMGFMESGNWDKLSEIVRDLHTNVSLAIVVQLI